MGVEVSSFSYDLESKGSILQHNFEKHKKLILYLVCALVGFIILYRIWFWIMGGLAIIGAVWVIREYRD
jgi:hypothetical protein